MDDNTRKEMDEVILKFKNDFLERFSIDPVVIYRNPETDIIHGIPLAHLHEILNESLWEVEPKVKYPKGILQKTREREVVVYRYCFMKIATDMGYRCSTIGRYVKYDHATVLHGNRTINELVEGKNFQVTNALEKIYAKLKNRFSNDGDVQPDNKQGTEPEPVLPIVLHQGEDIPAIPEPAPRIEKPIIEKLGKPRRPFPWLWV